MYVPSLISMHFVLSKIWLGPATIMKNEWLRGNNYLNIQCRIMIIVHCTSSNCHLSINQVSFQSSLYFPRYGRCRHPYKTKWLSRDKSVNIQSRIMVSLNAIYKPSFISIPFLLSTIWAGQSTTMKTWLSGDNSVQIQGMVIVHCIFSYSYQSISQVSLQSLQHF